MDVEIPEKLVELLFQPARYKIAYGGRGGAKSWGIARALLAMGKARPLRILCGREIQKSIKDSVHKLLSDQIKAMGLHGFYQILQTEIRGANGTEILFAGLKHNIDNIKSLESVDIAWIEEAHTVSKSSWDVLIPTIRKEGSEIWISFNPELESDETYKRFVLNPPKSAVVQFVSWRDNPWFPAVLRLEKDDKKEKDPDGYLHVWEGRCKEVLDGAVYAEEIRRALEAGRIGRVPHDPGKPVAAFWDLGWADFTSIWFAQSINHEFRVIDYYQNQLKKAAHYTAEMQGRGYLFDRIYLPHDAENESLNAERTTAQIVRAAFPNASVTVLPRLSVKEGIEAARTVFGQCWFDEALCADGLQALRHYRYEKDDSGEWSKTPLHDWASHGADAFRYLAVSIQQEWRGNNAPDMGMNWMS